MQKQKKGEKRHGVRRWLFRMLLILFGLALLFVFVGIPLGLSHLLTHARTRPMDLRLTTTPADYGIDYREIWLHAPEKAGAEEQVKLFAWYLPRPDAVGTILYAHGLFRSRHEMLERAAWLWQQGYAGLLLDLRRHGKSGGKLSSLGYRERLDIEAGVRFLAADRAARPFIAFGVSMGAAATILAAAETPEINALIVDSSFLSFENTITHHLKLFFGLPRFPLGDLIIQFTRMRIGFRKKDFNMERALTQISQRPLLVIAGGRDRRMPMEVERRLFESAATSKKQFVVIDNATHGAAFRTDRNRYEQAVLQFLQNYVRQGAD